MKISKYTSLSEINVTSLVDVTLVLLIIFMITAPLLRSGIEVELPKSKADDLNPGERIVVTLTKEGWLYLDGDRVLPENFEIRLSKVYTASGGKDILIKADKEVPYGKVVNIMDKIKGLGIASLGLVLEPSKEK